MFTSPPRCRRLFGTGLLLVALWLQALAPALALRLEAVASDPLAHPIICGQPLDEGAGASLPVPMPGCGVCPLCCAGALPPIVPQAPRATLPLRWHLLTWPLPRAAFPLMPPRHEGRARAPPALA